MDTPAVKSCTLNGMNDMLIGMPDPNMLMNGTVVALFLACLYCDCSLTPSRKESIQKTIMAMTLGKDVSSLFPDVLKNIATSDIEQKKLVYLYLMWVVLRVSSFAPVLSKLTAWFAFPLAL